MKTKDIGLVGVVGSQVVQGKGMDGSGMIGLGGAWHGQLLGPKSICRGREYSPKFVIKLFFC